MKKHISIAILTLLPASALAQDILSATRSFDPISKTAESITGQIHLLVDEGKPVQITFANGQAVGLVLVGPADADWEGAATAQIFGLDGLTGPLLNANTLCGNPESARYIALYDQGDDTLGMAVFDAETPPVSMDSDGLCATFSYLGL